MDTLANSYRKGACRTLSWHPGSWEAPHSVRPTMTGFSNLAITGAGVYGL